MLLCVCVCLLLIRVKKWSTESSLQYCTVNLRRKNRKLIVGGRPFRFTGYYVVDGVVFSQPHKFVGTHLKLRTPIFSQRKLRYSYRRPGVNSIDWGSRSSPCTHFPCWVLYGRWGVFSALWYTFSSRQAGIILLVEKTSSSGA